MTNQKRSYVLEEDRDAAMHIVAVVLKESARDINTDRPYRPWFPENIVMMARVYSILSNAKDTYRYTEVPPLKYARKHPFYNSTRKELAGYENLFSLFESGPWRVLHWVISYVVKNKIEFDGYCGPVQRYCAEIALDYNLASKQVRPSYTEYRYNVYRQEVYTAARLKYAHLGPEAADFIAEMIVYSFYRFPPPSTPDLEDRGFSHMGVFLDNNKVLKEAEFYEGGVEFLKKCSSMDEAERNKLMDMAIEDLIAQKLYPDEEMAMPYLSKLRGPIRSRVVYESYNQLFKSLIQRDMLYFRDFREWRKRNIDEVFDRKRIVLD